ncbi:hypothetical protein Aperf_G00000026943 [Anoplocephala perfoliata]
MVMRRRYVGLGPQMWRLYDGRGGGGGGSDGGNGSAGEGGSNLHSYGSGQLDLSVSTGSRAFQQQQAANSPYALDSGASRFTYEESDQSAYYNANPRTGSALPPPLGMYEQNYRNCYQNNASMTAAAVAAAAYNYHYQQQQIQQQQQQQQQQQHQETDSHYDRAPPPPYDYARNRYLF